MNRRFAGLLVVALAAVLLSTTVRAAPPKEGTIAASGLESVRVQPTLLRLEVQLRATGATAEKAVEQLKTRRKAAIAKLKDLKAEEGSVRFTSTVLTRNATPGYGPPGSGTPVPGYSPPSGYTLPPTPSYAPSTESLPSTVPTATLGDPESPAPTRTPTAAASAPQRPARSSSMSVRRQARRHRPSPWNCGRKYRRLCPRCRREREPMCHRKSRAVHPRRTELSLPRQRSAPSGG